MSRSSRSMCFLICVLLGTLIAFHAGLTGFRTRTPYSPDQRIEFPTHSSKLFESRREGLYHRDPRHIWNRLYRSLYARVDRDGHEYGYDELDPLFWSQTKHLLSGASNEKAVTVLDEFLSTRAERLIGDPLKRAILQRDLLAVFYWSTTKYDDTSLQKRNLQIRLAQALRRLALSRRQIQELPNNYAEGVASRAFSTTYASADPPPTFLPPDLLRSDGSWVPVSVYGGGEPVALTHVSAFSGRSVFRVFIRLPGGRQTTLDYIKAVESFPEPWIRYPLEPERLLPNPRLPEFPVGTQLALVRQMILIDRQGHLTPTTLTENVQIRVHRAIPSAIPEGLDVDSNKSEASLDVFEFKLSREKLFSGKSGGLRAVTRDDKEFPLFLSHDRDLFETASEQSALERHLRPSLSFCARCHFRPGIHSVLSRRQHKLVASCTPDYEEDVTIGWKQRRPDWRLLKGLWRLRPTTRPRRVSIRESGILPIPAHPRILSGQSHTCLVSDLSANSS